MKKVFFINPDLFVECDNMHEFTTPCTFHLPKCKLNGSLSFIVGSDMSKARMDIGIKSSINMVSVDTIACATTTLLNSKNELESVLIPAFKMGFFQTSF